jgi:hypothetical protein
MRNLRIAFLVVVMSLTAAACASDSGTDATDVPDLVSPAADGDVPPPVETLAAEDIASIAPAE